MEKKVLSEKKEVSFRKYRRFTLNTIFLILCISIWSTMMTDLNWRFKDISFECISLIVIIICGMFSNIENKFSLFHLRSIKITKERLVSILIGILFPVSFIIYFMISDSEFMNYISNISLHDFTTLMVLLVPIMIIISLILYFSYILLETKHTRVRIGEYALKTEKSFDNYKMISLTFVGLISLVSIWLKLSFNYNWMLLNIKTEVVVLIVLVIMKIISNLKNKLPWNYSNRLHLGIYFYLCLIVPYLVFGLACLISSSLRENIMIIGFKKTVSLIVSYSPLVFLVAVVVTCFSNIVTKLNNHTKKNLVKQMDKTIKHENIVISIALSLFAIMLIFIYIITAVLTSLDVGLLAKLLFMLMPVGVVLYLVIYYSIVTINK